MPSIHQRAEEMPEISSPELNSLPHAEIQKLVLEMQVHQIELQIQNEKFQDAQAELSRQHDHYRDLFDFAPVGYLTIDKEGCIQEANVAVAEILGLNQKQLLGRKFSDFLAADSQDAWHIHRRELINNKKDSPCELKLQLAGQCQRTFQLHSQSLSQDITNPTCCRVALTDITEHTVAKDALSQLNINLTKSLTDRAGEVRKQVVELRLMQAAISHLAEGVLITEYDLHWPAPTIVFVNEAMCRISGYTSQELVGQSPIILQGKATDYETLLRMKLDLQAGKPCVAELVNYRKDGSPYYAEIFVTPLTNSKGQRTHYVSIHRDMSNRRALEKEVLNISAAEHRRIGNDLHDGIGQELTGLSLLARSLVISLKENQVPEVHIAKKIDTGILRALADVRALAHGMNPVDLDAGGLMSSLSEMSIRLRELYGVDCRWECESPVQLPDSQAANQLYRIAQEATTNSVKHGQATSIVICLSRQGQHAVLRIVDDGIGITPDAASQHGLGLRTMCYRASVIGGELEIHPRLEGGTEVCCTVPCIYDL